ncbi:MAG TPA: helix-turn-helix domain-containing protein [Acetobacteraceae bacterium]|nr:helix-turn-helix domain-containing protein [Acetobacteraceae bacterium]
MAITRMTLEQIKASRPNVDRAKLDATTEEDIRRYMIEDGEDPDYELRDEDIISPWYIRRRLGMSQTEFADALHIPVATLRNWEQHRVGMDPSTIALMTILAREPEAALRALRRRAA